MRNKSCNASSLPRFYVYCIEIFWKTRLIFLLFEHNGTAKMLSWFIFILPHYRSTTVELCVRKLKFFRIDSRKLTFGRKFGNKKICCLSSMAPIHSALNYIDLSSKMAYATRILIFFPFKIGDHKEAQKRLDGELSIKMSSNLSFRKFDDKQIS